MAIEVRTLNLQNDKAPVSGNALYIVVEQKERVVVLLHPVQLAKFEISATEYREAADKGVMLYPINNSGTKFDREMMSNLLIAKMKDYSKRQKGYAAQVVRHCAAELSGLEVTKIPMYKENVERGPVQRSAKRPGVIDAIVEQLHKGATIDEMVAALKETFPDRNADGMRTTVRCQINRLPAKLSLKMDKIEDKKRGQIFKFAAAGGKK